MQLALAPMENLVDDLLRDTLTRIGGIDWCVSEFIRVTHSRLPARTYYKIAPELQHGSRTPAGTPMHIQLLGGDPGYLAENAVMACSLGAPVIDLNFGCPAKCVNNSRGGAILLNEPELLYKIISEVRRSIPADIPVTAKMRLGYDSPAPALDCARALTAAGAAQLVVHARTRMDGYKPPAHWEWIARIQDVVAVPVYANGEIWTLEDWQRCKAISGAQHFMLGRGLVARPDLALQIRALSQGTDYRPLSWDEMRPIVHQFWRNTCEKLLPVHAPGRLKQWLNWLGRSYPQAQQIFDAIKRERSIEGVAAYL